MIFFPARVGPPPAPHLDPARPAKGVSKAHRHAGANGRRPPDCRSHGRCHAASPGNVPGRGRHHSTRHDLVRPGISPTSQPGHDPRVFRGEGCRQRADFDHHHACVDAGQGLGGQDGQVRVGHLRQDDRGPLPPQIANQWEDDVASVRSNRSPGSSRATQRQRVPRTWPMTRSSERPCAAILRELHGHLAQRRNPATG